MQAVQEFIAKGGTWGEWDEDTQEAIDEADAAAIALHNMVPQFYPNDIEWARKAFETDPEKPVSMGIKKRAAEGSETEQKPKNRRKEQSQPIQGPFLLRGEEVQPIDMSNAKEGTNLTTVRKKYQKKMRELGMEQQVQQLPNEDELEEDSIHLYNLYWKAAAAIKDDELVHLPPWETYQTAMRQGKWPIEAHDTDGDAEMLPN